MNDFDKDLAFSHDAEDLLIWREIYNKAFPGNLGFTSQRANGELQQHGIDRTVILQSGKAIYVDEKVRREDYGDILLEYISNDQTKSPGWVEKPLYCDFIAYAILPSGKCYILPVPQLQAAWTKNKSSWISNYGTTKAKNRFYKTLGCPVPPHALFPEIGAELRVSFSYKQEHREAG